MEAVAILFRKRCFGHICRKQCANAVRRHARRLTSLRQGQWLQSLPLLGTTVHAQVSELHEYPVIMQMRAVGRRNLWSESLATEFEPYGPT